MIVIVDYGMGNLGSVVNAFMKLKVPVLATSDVNEISRAERIVLPGVGFFAKGMENLRALGLIDTLNKKALEEKVPFLGICLGMQLLTSFSEEGNAEGLGWINAKTVRFNFSDGAGLRIPHVGWNKIAKKEDPLLLSGIAEDNRFYFTHSYHVAPKDENILAFSFYGYDFASVIQSGNIFGVQFHPETSHKDGLLLLKNFAEIGSYVAN
ncbi:MAG: imidazole glycerol phosphate synthase subunit HisH [Candidatus Omnitrophica bacterium]|nr:imidazole glycerol phosphate synthase subunit HisH [Candidatus Omnitrophota bacterium]